MPYCTLDQLTTQYGRPTLVQATDRQELSTGEIDTDAVARAIASADALIDGYLKPRYALPLDATPPLVNELSLVISLYKLHAAVAPDKVRQDYTDAIARLTQISTGAIKLDVAGVEPASSGASGARITDRPRPFSSENLKVY